MQLLFSNTAVAAGQELYSGHLPWHGIRTRSNHEKVASIVLRGKGFEPYVPFYTDRKRRQDNTTAETQRPIFPGYVFCRFDAKNQLPILMTPGVVSLVGFGSEPAPIPDEEIEAVKAVLRSGFPAEPCTYFRDGQRVRVIDGSLEGVEGILLRRRDECRMAVSVTLLQRSISVEIEADRLAAI